MIIQDIHRYYSEKKSQFNYSRNITFDKNIKESIENSLKSQFNYSRNITFDKGRYIVVNWLLYVAIQLFAEYNFWFYFIYTFYNQKKWVAIQLFAEYNFWYI